MTTFYRFENSAGQGPYNSYDPRLDEMVIRHSDDLNGHPNLRNDCGYQRTYSESEKAAVFGFESIEQANAWFSPGEQLVMFNCGFRLRALSGTLFVRGNKQVTFLKSG